MARYKHSDIENGQGVFLTVNLKSQLLPGTFEHMLDDLIDRKIDISVFDGNYRNDETGCKAIPPAVLIKLIIYGYSKGIKSSRKLMVLGMENIIAKALSGEMEPHWTTISDFISANSERFQEIFVKVLAYCSETGLVGGQTFAIDGLRLPSNASIDLSGTEEELAKKLEMYRKMAEKHVAKHRKLDEQGQEDKEAERHYQERQKYLNRQVEKISNFLEKMEKRHGTREMEIKSNVTDNESAMIKSSKGFLQGYTGIAVADKQNQIIVNAEAIGSGYEGRHLPSILDNTLKNMSEAAVKTPDGSKLTALMDANYFSEENLRACQERGIEAIIPDFQYRNRLGGKKHYETCDFQYNEEGNYYLCPNGKCLEHKKTTGLRGLEWKTYRASFKDCRTCHLNTKCIKTKKDISKIGRGRKLMISETNEPDSLSIGMRKKLATEEYQNQYAYRLQIVEPVFANIAYCKGLDRFTLRGGKKVNGQWKLFCIVHNLGKCLKGYNKSRGYTL